MNFSRKNHELNKKSISSVSKKVFLTVLTLTLINVSFAQKIDYGAKAGLNYNFGGDLSDLLTGATDAFEDISTGADDKAGFHIGFWAKINLVGLYVRPEISYAQLNNSYASSGETLDTDFKTNKIDIPILIGAKVVGPLHLFAGPSFQYITKSNFSQSDITDLKTDDFSVGMQLGAGLELGRLGVDVRWEKGFSNDLDGKFRDTNFNVDNRPNQIVFGLSYRLNERNK